MSYEAEALALTSEADDAEVKLVFKSNRINQECDCDMHDIVQGDEVHVKASRKHSVM